MDIKQKIKMEEGRRYVVYQCTQGYPTIADGVKLPLKKEELELISKSRGYAITNEKIMNGFKLTDKECDILLTERLQPILEALNNVKLFKKAPKNVRIVLVDMAYNLGLRGLSKFRKMLKAIDQKNFGIASKELLNSRYAKQVPNRAQRNADLMLKV